MNEIGYALDLVQDGLNAAQKANYMMIIPDLYCAQGDLLLAKGDPTSRQQAEVIFGSMLITAKQMGALGYELRAAIRLAELLQQQDRPEDALNLLTETYGKFSQGFDTTDLLHARYLISDLENTSIVGGDP